MKRALAPMACATAALLSVAFLTRSSGPTKEAGIPGVDAASKPAQEINAQLAGLPDALDRVAPEDPAGTEALAGAHEEGELAQAAEVPEVDIQVKVIDHAGRILEGVRVGIAQPGNWGSYKHYRSKRTDSRGEVHFAAFPSGKFWAEVDPKSLPPNTIACRRTNSSADGPEEESLVLMCPMPGSLSGRVLRQDGTPLSTGRVWLRSVDHDAKDIYRFPDAAGHFAVTPLHPGLWNVYLEATDARPLAGLSVPGSQEVLIQPGLAQRVELRCPSKGYWIKGEVVDQNGAPVPGLLVSTGPFRRYPDGELITKIIGTGYAFAQTNESGCYRLGPLARKEYLVQVADSRSTKGASSDSALLAKIPRGFLAQAGNTQVHRTVVERITDTLEWSITPILGELFDQAAGPFPGPSFEDWTVKVDGQPLPVQRGRPWTFTTSRDLEGLSIKILDDAGGPKPYHTGWTIDLSKLWQDEGEITLPLPPPPELR